jgi:hypothetical protein
MSCIVKKVFVITLFLTILLSTAKGVGFGIKAGMNIANWHGDHAGGMDSRLGFCGGGFVGFGLTDMLVIQPEVLYTQKGVRWEIRQSPLVPWKETIKLDYIEIPLLFKFMLPDKSTVKPNLFVGPCFAINVNAKEKIEETGTPTELDYGEFVKDIEFGIVLGGGVDFPLKKGKVVFDGRYTLGLTTTSEEGWDLKNKVVSFMLGYSF